ncbi:hypothetical protein CABS01_16387, partial [Colletotrichum abscissum]|uniref:uncharacterized protein n=1 Tax=Colletotrichum abscissum TaxID=1671311 RepID=UPI0027D683D8
GGRHSNERPAIGYRLRAAFSLFSGRLPYCFIADFERCDRAPSSQHQIPAERRRQVIYTPRRSDLRLKEPTSVDPRPDGVLIDNRRRCHDGFLYDFCPFRTISKPIIERHLNRRPFRATTGRWASSHASIASSHMPVSLQAWVRNPPRSQYWTDSRADAATTEVRPFGRDEGAASLTRRLAREEAFHQRSAVPKGKNLLCRPGGVFQQHSSGIHGIPTLARADGMGAGVCQRGPSASLPTDSAASKALVSPSSSLGGPVVARQRDR